MIDPDLWRLRNRLRALERMIRDAQRAGEPDAALIGDLERRRRQVKDELFMAEAGLVPRRLRPNP